MSELDPFVLTIDHDTWSRFMGAAIEYKHDVPEHVIIAGIPGSGTTVLAQIVRSLGINMTKVHGYNTANAPKLVMYRDPRDLICGVALRQLKSVTDVDGTLAGQMAAYNYLFRDQKFHLTFEKYADDPNSHLLRYETYLPGQMDMLVCNIAWTLGMHLRQWFISYLSWEFSVHRNQLRSAPLYGEFSRVDKVSGIHGSHVTSCGRSTWERSLCRDVVRLVNEELHDFMVKWGYL